MMPNSGYLHYLALENKKENKLMSLLLKNTSKSVWSVAAVSILGEKRIRDNLNILSILYYTHLH